jgi:cell wall assembly regulator SMI1
MRSIWERLAAVASKTPKSLRLRPGASEASIRAAERTIGLPFPEDFRDSLLLHDGQESGDGDDDAFEWLPGHGRLARLDAIVAEWKQECATYEQFHTAEAPQEIGGGHLYHYLWHPKRIPIAGNPWWDQDHTYLDFFPGPQGISGQVVMFGKGSFGEVHGPSLRAAMELYVHALESGEWVFRDGQCVPRAKRGSSWAGYTRKKLARLPR